MKAKKGTTNTSMRFLTILGLLMFFLSTIGCTFYETLPDQVIYERTRTISRYEEKRKVEIEQNPGVRTFGGSSILIRVIPEKECVKTNNVYVKKKDAEFRDRDFLVQFVLLGLMNAILISDAGIDDANPEDEKEEQRRVHLAAALLLDVSFLFGTLRSFSEYRRIKSSKPFETKDNPSINCTDICNVEGKEGYLKVVIDRKNYCLPLGTFNKNKEIIVESEVFARNSVTMFKGEERKTFEAFSTQDLFLLNEVIIPECGDYYHDCLFWKKD